MKKLTILILLTVCFSIIAKAQVGMKIYGGKNYDKFLGCLACDGDEPGSIWSPFTEYGSTHNAKSIWNKLGIYGSVTSNFSPYNPKAKYPPRVVDANGKMLGYLTVNKDNPKRFKGVTADLICLKRDMVLRDGVEKYGGVFTKVN